METHAKFRPTSFDSPGLSLEDRQDWFVAPCSHNRDSTLLYESNWATMLKEIPEGEDAEIHRFGHWGCGWFEIMIVRPGSDAMKKMDEIEGRLENYPVLSDEDYSEREYEATYENVKEIVSRVIRNAAEGTLYENAKTEDVAGKVDRWLGDNEPGEVESRDDQGGYPSEEAVVRALTSILSKEDDDGNNENPCHDTGREDFHSDG